MKKHTFYFVFGLQFLLFFNDRIEWQIVCHASVANVTWRLLSALPKNVTADSTRRPISKPERFETRPLVNGINNAGERLINKWTELETHLCGFGVSPSLILLRFFFFKPQSNAKKDFFFAGSLYDRIPGKTFIFSERGVWTFMA